MDIAGPPPLRPPVPTAPEVQLSLRAFLRAVRTNALTIFPRAAYHEDSTSRRLLGGMTITLNAPDAIHHVLVGNPGNFRRSPASIRVLRPITGEGLLLSEGDAWKLQRRTIAPALGRGDADVGASYRCQRRSSDRQADHEVRRAHRPARQHAEPRIGYRRPLDVLADMDRYGATMRTLMTEFGERYAQPHLLDMLLPPSIPTSGTLLGLVSGGDG